MHPGDYTLVTPKNGYNVRIMGVLNNEYWQIYIGKDEPTGIPNFLEFRTYGIDFGSMLVDLITTYLNKKSPKELYKLICNFGYNSSSIDDDVCLELCKCGTTLEEKI